MFTGFLGLLLSLLDKQRLNMRTSLIEATDVLWYITLGRCSSGSLEFHSVSDGHRYLAAHKSFVVHQDQNSKLAFHPQSRLAEMVGQYHPYEIGPRTPRGHERLQS